MSPYCDNYVEVGGMESGWSGKREQVMKRIKGNIVYTALWLTGIVSLVFASGAPHKLTGWPF